MRNLRIQIFPGVKKQRCTYILVSFHLFSLPFTSLSLLPSSGVLRFPLRLKGSQSFARYSFCVQTPRDNKTRGTRKFCIPTIPRYTCTRCLCPGASRGACSIEDRSNKFPELSLHRYQQLCRTRGSRVVADTARTFYPILSRHDPISISISKCRSTPRGRF